MAASKAHRSTARKPSGGRRRRASLIGVLVLLIVVGLGVWAWQSASETPGRTVPTQGNAHIATPSDPHPPYNTDPPTSGPHVAYIAPWGAHTSPVPRELQVHNLEDGGVLVQYNCDCPELIVKLRSVVERYKDRVILAPYPGMKERIVLTAWGRIDTMNDFDEKRIGRFINAYRGIDHHPR